MIDTRPLNQIESDRLQQLWNDVQLLISENYGAGRLLRNEQDVSWIQRVVDEQLLWPDQSDFITGLGVALGETIVACHPDVQWVANAEQQQAFPLLHSEATQSVLDVVSLFVQQFAATRTDVGRLYQQCLDNLVSP